MPKHISIRKTDGSGWSNANPTVSDGTQWKAKNAYNENGVSIANTSMTSSTFQPTLTSVPLSNTPGKVVLIFGSCLSTRTISATSGWTLVRSTGAGGKNHYLWSRTLTGSEVTADYTFTLSSGNVSWNIYQIVLDNAIDTIPTEASAASGGTVVTSVSLGPLTSVAAGSLVILSVSSSVSSTEIMVPDNTMQSIRTGTGNGSLRMCFTVEYLPHANRILCPGMIVKSTDPDRVGVCDASAIGVVIRPTP